MSSEYDSQGKGGPPALGVIGKTVSGAIEGVAEGVLAPVAAAATVGQLTVHAGCAISAAF